MSWRKQLEDVISEIPDTVSSNTVIRQALRILRQRPCYGEQDGLYQADMMRKKGSDARKVAKY